MKTFDLKQFYMDTVGYVKNEFVVFMAALVAPATPMIILIGVLVISDTISAIYGTVKHDGWNSFKSKLMSNGLLPKIIFYPLAILISQSVEHVFPSVPMLKTTGFILMSIEVKSISENYKKIFGISIFGSLKRIFQRHIDEDKADK